MREAEMDRRDLIILPCRRVAMTPSPFTSISPIIFAECDLQAATAEVQQKKVQRQHEMNAKRKKS